QRLTAPSAAQQLVIFDCRFSLADFALGRQQYADGHIPNALHLEMEVQLSGDKKPHGGRHPLPTAAQFTASMQKMGVNQNSIIVAYDDNRLAGAARLWWLLQHFGHPHIRILDGGLQAWRAQGLPVSQDTQAPQKGYFQANPRAGQTVDYSWLSAHLKDRNLQLIDSREAPRYQGLEEPIDPVAGHIPGALNYPWQGVTNEQGKALSAGKQQDRWAGLDSEKETVVYCGSGVTACVNLLSLKLAGIEGAKLYPGSWSDWCSYADSPKQP
ncbi:MAG: sulfurtransferase, partial [Pseudomonadales bacterium]|nr:sulfurtransferase [Pseudomonadales bacterium]